MIASKPAPQPAPAAGQKNVLRLLVLGFNENERRLLHAVVLLSQRRDPVLQLLGEAEAENAEVVMIDMLDSTAALWANRQPWLKRKPVIWIYATGDVPSEEVAPGHTKLRRPVHWSSLPALLTRVLDDWEATPGLGQETQTAAPPRPVPVIPAAAAAADGKRVLVVDDSLAVRRQLQTFLEKKGLHPSFAEDGEAAIKSCATTRYDCILLDVLMPGMDGYETCRRIKALPKTGKDVKIIMLTSRTSPFDRIRGKMAGCDAYLTKPVEAEKLHETLRRHL